jgi:hypothetical protein
MLKNSIYYFNSSVYIIPHLDRKYIVAISPVKMSLIFDV